MTGIGREDLRESFNQFEFAEKTQTVTTAKDRDLYAHSCAEGKIYVWRSSFTNVYDFARPSKTTPKHQP